MVNQGKPFATAARFNGCRRKPFRRSRWIGPFYIERFEVRRTVCRDYLGLVERELVFDDWTWHSVESVDEEGIHETQPLTNKQAIELYDDRYRQDCPIPLELKFLESLSDSLIEKDCVSFNVMFRGKKEPFCPQYWTILGTRSDSDGYDGDLPAVEWVDWLFGGNGAYVKLEFTHYPGADAAPPPTLVTQTKEEAADYLALNGYPLPNDLKGQGSVRILTPETILGLGDEGNGDSEEDDASTNATLKGVGFIDVAQFVIDRNWEQQTSTPRLLAKKWTDRDSDRAKEWRRKSIGWDPSYSSRPLYRVSDAMNFCQPHLPSLDLEERKELKQYLNGVAKTPND